MARTNALKTRKDCLLKKASELSTLCGVDVALIIYGPATGQHRETFSPNLDEVMGIITRYRASAVVGAAKKKIKQSPFHSTDQVAALLDKLNSRIEHVQKLIVSKEKQENAFDFFSGEGFEWDQQDNVSYKIEDVEKLIVSDEKQEEVVSTAFDYGLLDWDAVMNSVECSSPGEGFQERDALMDSIDFLFYGCPRLP